MTKHPHAIAFAEERIPVDPVIRPFVLWLATCAFCIGFTWAALTFTP